MANWWGNSGNSGWLYFLVLQNHWAPKHWCFWTVVLEKTLESPLDCKEIQPVHPKDQSWVFIGKTDIEAETLILWPSDGKSWLLGKDPYAGNDWGQEENGPTEDEMAGWHHRLDEQGFGWTSGTGDGQRGLECCSPWGNKESDMTEPLSWTDKYKPSAKKSSSYKLSSLPSLLPLPPSSSQELFLPVY